MNVLLIENLTNKRKVARPVRVDALVICRKDLPKWWDNEDTEACKRHWQWDLTDWYRNMGEHETEAYYSLPVSEFEQRQVDEWCEKHIDKFTCRRCEHWNSENGEKGYCEILRANTLSNSMCEEWYPRLEITKQFGLGI